MKTCAYALLLFEQHQNPLLKSQLEEQSNGKMQAFLLCSLYLLNNGHIIFALSDLFSLLSNAVGSRFKNTLFMSMNLLTR